jgi:L-rhamnose mutarotase
MKRLNQSSTFIIVLVLLIIMAGCTQKEVLKKETNKVTKRIGMVIGLKPEMIEEYKKLHADDNPGVRDLLARYNIHNFSIFLQEINGKWYEFGYYEYTGTDYQSDMAKLAAEPRNIEWLKLCDPMQIPLPGSEGWTEMKRIYFNR